MLPLNASSAAQLASLAATEGTGAQEISWLGVFIATLAVLVNGVVSVVLSLDMHWDLLVGTIRCIVQLTVLGLVLGPIFQANQPSWVLLYATFMLLMGGQEASSRPKLRYTGLFADVVLSFGMSAAIFLSYTLLLVIHVQPTWWTPQYFIPILGMLLGNAITGVAIGVSTVLEDISAGRDKVELILVLGGSRWDCTKESVQRAVRVACTSIVNQMAVCGVVSIPGMLTGQILAGADPSQAARYQMIIMFCISGTTTLGSVVATLVAASRVVDPLCRVRLERLRVKPPGGGAVTRYIVKGLQTGTAAVGRFFGRCLPQRRQRNEDEVPLLGH